MPDEKRPEEIPAPFFRFTYNSALKACTITAHTDVSGSNTGALFGASCTREEFRDVFLHWLTHLNSGTDFMTSLPASWGEGAVVKVGRTQ